MAPIRNPWRGVFVSCHHGSPAAMLIRLPNRGGLEQHGAVGLRPGVASAARRCSTGDCYPFAALRTGARTAPEAAVAIWRTYAAHLVG